MYLHKSDRDDVIRYLADKYPQCFFENPGLRRPLKHDILDDLEKERVLDRNKLAQALDWYQSHFVYRYAIVAGVERVDLAGKKAGTVTETEQREARAWVAARKKEVAEQKALREPAVPRSPTPVKEPTKHEPPMIKTAPPPTHLHPNLAELSAALDIVSSLMTEPQYESMRSVLVEAALNKMINDAAGLIGSLHGKEAQP